MSQRGATTPVSSPIGVPARPQSPVVTTLSNASGRVDHAGRAIGFIRPSSDKLPRTGGGPTSEKRPLSTFIASTGMCDSAPNGPRAISSSRDDDCVVPLAGSVPNTIPPLRRTIGPGRAVASDARRGGRSLVGVLGMTPGRGQRHALVPGGAPR